LSAAQAHLEHACREVQQVLHAEVTLPVPRAALLVAVGPDAGAKPLDGQVAHTHWLLASRGAAWAQLVQTWKSASECRDICYRLQDGRQQPGIRAPAGNLLAHNPASAVIRSACNAAKTVSCKRLWHCNPRVDAVAVLQAGSKQQRASVLQADLKQLLSCKQAVATAEITHLQSTGRGYRPVVLAR
jgi:hypothetical protein